MVKFAFLLLSLFATLATALYNRHGITANAFEHLDRPVYSNGLSRVRNEELNARRTQLQRHLKAFSLVLGKEVTPAAISFPSYNRNVLERVKDAKEFLKELKALDLIKLALRGIDMDKTVPELYNLANVRYIDQGYLEPVLFSQQPIDHEFLQREVEVAGEECREISKWQVQHTQRVDKKLEELLYVYCAEKKHLATLESRISGFRLYINDQYIHPFAIMSTYYNLILEIDFHNTKYQAAINDLKKSFGVVIDGYGQIETTSLKTLAVAGAKALVAPCRLNGYQRIARNYAEARKLSATEQDFNTAETILRQRQKYAAPNGDSWWIQDILDNWSANMGRKQKGQRVRIRN